MMPEASGASCGANACGFSRKKTSATVSPSAGVRPATYTKDFTRTLALAEITAPAYACEARTTGPLVRSSTRSNAFTSSLRDVKGIGAAITLNPVACKGPMTLLQLAPSAHAPWTTTLVIVSLLPRPFGRDRHAVRTGRTPPRFRSRAPIFFRAVETANGSAASYQRWRGVVIQMAATTKKKEQPT